MLDNYLSGLFNNAITGTLIVLILLAYRPHYRPELPESIYRLFSNSYFRIAILSLVVYNGNRNVFQSILISIGFIAIMDMLNKKGLEERFSQF